MVSLEASSSAMWPFEREVFVPALVSFEVVSRIVEGESDG